MLVLVPVSVCEHICMRMCCVYALCDFSWGNWNKCVSVGLANCSTVRAIPVEDQSSGPSMHIRQLTTACDSSSRVGTSSPRAPVSTHT